MSLFRFILVALFLAAVSGMAATRYVNLNNPSPGPPYTSWDTAATTNQDAVDAAVVGDLVLVHRGRRSAFLEDKNCGAGGCVPSADGGERVG